MLGEIGNNARILTNHALATLTVIVSGFLLSATIGIPLALAISFSPVFNRTVYPIIVFSQLIPKIAIAPLFVIWFGFGFLPTLLIAFLVRSSRSWSRPSSASPLFALSRSVSPSRWAPALSRYFSRCDSLTRCRIFSTGLKMAMASASIGAIVGEFIASQQGLGYLILVANGEMNTSLAFAGMLLLCLTGVALYFVVETVERVVTGWHVSQRAGAAT